MKASTVSYFRLTLLFFIYVGCFEVTRGFQVQATSQMWTPSDNAALQRFQCSPFFRQWREKNQGSTPNLNGSGPMQAYSCVDTPWKHCEGAGYCLCSCQTAIGDWSHENEQLDEFASVMTNSSGGLIGGSCTGGLLLLVVVIYILYRLLRKPEPGRTATVNPVVVTVPQTNCPRCRARNLPISPPPTYEDSFSSPPIAWEDCIVCMSTEGRMPYPTN